MSCLEIITDYGLRSIGLGERLLPKTDFTICHQLTLIGSGMLWNIYFGTVALASGFVLATLLDLGKAANHFYIRKASEWFIFVSEVFKVADIVIREDGRGYGGQFKFEMKLNQKGFANQLRKAQSEVYG